MKYKEREAFARGYIVTSDCEVIGNRGKPLKYWEDKRGYYYFRYGHSVNIGIHRMIAYQKFGDLIYEPNTQVRHRNGNSLDNSWDNILIGSPSENALDKSAELRLKVAHIAADKVKKLSIDQVKQLREDRKNGYSYQELMEKYNIAKSTVSYVVNKKTYSRVAD